MIFYFSTRFKSLLELSPCIIQAQNLTLETISQKALPWIVAIFNSSSEGLREPSLLAKVPAPQGDPEINDDKHKCLSTALTVQRTTMNLIDVAELRKGTGVTEGNMDNSMMRESRHGVQGSGLLSSTRASGGGEDRGVFTPESTSCPEATSAVPESLIERVILGKHGFVD